MDKAKIAKLCNEIEDIVCDISKQTMNDIISAESRMIFDKAKEIAAELTATPESEVQDNAKDKTGCYICKHAKTENIHGRQEVWCCLDDMFVMRPSKGCNFCEKKVLSNADRIRQMTDEELAEYLGSSICDRRESGDCQRFKNCEECKLSWIREEVSEDATD